MVYEGCGGARGRNGGSVSPRLEHGEYLGEVDAGRLQGDEDVEEEMKRACEEDQVILDPHAAAASAALRAYQDDSSDDHAAVILGTVSPLKSAEIVLNALGKPENDPAQAVDALAEMMGTEVPEALKGLFEKDSIHDKSINAEDVMSETTAILQLM